MEIKFGLKVNPIIEEIVGQIKSGRILDLGAGFGANSIYLAKSGFKVESIDKNKEAISYLKILTKKENLKLKAINKNILDFKIRNNFYDVIIALNVFQFLSHEDFSTLFKKSILGLKKEGIIIVQTFSKKDPGFLRLKSNPDWKFKNNHTFISKVGDYRHFSTTKEISKLANGVRIKEIKEYKIQDNHKPYGPHFHFLINFIGIKI